MSELLRQAAREWDIVLVAPVQPGASRADEPATFAERIEVPPGDVRGGFMQVDQAQLLESAYGALARWQPDATLAWGVVEATSLARLQPSVLDFIDSMTLTHLRSARHAKAPLVRVRHLRDAFANARHERQLVREAAASLVAGRAWEPSALRGGVLS